MSNMYAYAQHQLSLLRALSISRTHNLWLPPSAVRQTEGRGGDEGSQVARVQAVVCTVISVQVFKQPDVCTETGGEAVIVDTHMNGDVRQYTFRYLVMYSFACVLGRGVDTCAFMRTFCLSIQLLFTPIFTAVWLPGCGSASVV